MNSFLIGLVFAGVIIGFPVLSLRDQIENRAALNARDILMVEGQKIIHNYAASPRQIFGEVDDMTQGLVILRHKMGRQHNVDLVVLFSVELSPGIEHAQELKERSFVDDALLLSQVFFNRFDLAVFQIELGVNSTKPSLT